MTTQDIKEQISREMKAILGTFNFTRQFNEGEVIKPEEAGYNAANPSAKHKVETPWVSHWDDIYRVRVTMHENIMAQIKADPKKADLAVKRELVAAHDGKAAYMRYVIITPKNIELTF